MKSSFSLRLSLPIMSITAFVRDINEIAGLRFRSRSSGNRRFARQNAALSPKC